MEEFDFVIPEEYRSPESVEVAKVLLDFWLNNKEKIKCLMFYQELCNKLSFRVDCRHVEKYLGDISFACKENGLPPLSAIVVNQSNCFPGAGFYKAYFPGQRVKADDRVVIWNKLFKEICNFPYWNKVLEKYKML